MPDLVQLKEELRMELKKEYLQEMLESNLEQWIGKIEALSKVNGNFLETSMDSTVITRIHL